MRVLWLTGVIIVIDQTTKLLILRSMYLGQQIPILGDWLKLTFTENPGMAFGITFGPTGLVTMFSIIATVLIVFYLYQVRHDYYPYRASLALILGGALGNIIDRVFYGALFGGEALFSGKVVDFIHVNIWSGFIAESIPMIGGTYISLFPIWNVADMAIVMGVVGIIAFQKRHHQDVYERELARSEQAMPPDVVPMEAVAEEREHAPTSAARKLDDDGTSARASSA